jgi:hypothetical protein
MESRNWMIVAPVAAQVLSGATPKRQTTLRLSSKVSGQKPGISPQLLTRRGIEPVDEEAL